MIDVEAHSDVVGQDAELLVPLIQSVCNRMGLTCASVGLLIVTSERMAEINGDHRDKPEPTDVLSFPIDGPDSRGSWPEDGPAPELGDIIICPAAANDPLTTLAVHGLLHLLGYDHETDSGEMLNLQDELLGELVA